MYYASEMLVVRSEYISKRRPGMGKIGVGILSGVLLSLCISLFSFADTVYLLNGNEWQGEIYQETEDYIFMIVSVLKMPKSFAKKANL